MDVNKLAGAYLIIFGIINVLHEAEAECNCLDGFSGRDGVYGWDPIQERYKCVTAGCYVITD
jgi:hypothetical protein